MTDQRRQPVVRAALLALASVTACKSAQVTADPPVQAAVAAPAGSYVGFDRNEYPGDDRLAELHKHFAFVGYWLTNPPKMTSNTWVGKRKAVRDAGFGFLLLADGRWDAEIKKSNLKPGELGKQDAAEAVAAAKREGFPAGAIIFLDQEEGGRLLPEQADYFFGWTEAVAASAYKPGGYVSGQPSDDGNGPDGKPVTITTAQNVREEVAKRHLHPVALWVVEDGCPPAPGCVVQPSAPKQSGTIDADVWQYAQSPRRPEITKACAKTYAADGVCYAGVSTDISLDLDAATSADPSHGR